MSDTIHLTPEYLESDFLSMKEKLINLLSNTEIFKDYNYEGANITMLLELVSYLGDFSHFYMNEIAKNIYPDTSTLYETTHSLVTQRGYQPNGYISADLDLKVTIKRYNEDQTIEYYKEGDQLYMPAWFPLNTEQTNSDGENIWFSTTYAKTFTLPLSGDISTYDFYVPVKQGTAFTTTYSGSDIIDGAIILPFKNIDMGTYPYDEENPSLVVYVDEEPWTRVYDFYDELSGLGVNDDVYKLVYDKYGRYSIQFSTARNMPTDKSRIRAVMLESYGINGTLGANLLVREDDTSLMNENVPSLVDRNWVTTDTPFLHNLTKTIDIPGSQISYINESASVTGADPETTDQIKSASKKIANSQNRNVTKSDYIGDLENRSDIVKANVWGMQEVNERTIYDYNKVFISVIPKDWTTYTIPTSGFQWVDPMVPDVSQEIKIPYDFDLVFQNELKSHLEPSKILSTFEEFIIPDLVYFKFEIGIVPKRVYNFNNIVIDARNKLDYYFDATNRSFNEVIDFKEIGNYITDTSVKSSTDSFENTRGIQNIVFRDIVLYTTRSNNDDPMEIFEFNDEDKFPMFTVREFDIRYDNLLKPIALGLTQFPVLAKDMCIFINEG